MNIVRVFKDEKWLNTNLPILENLWKDVEYYRSTGIENHPSFPKKKNIIDFTSEKTGECQEEDQEYTLPNECLILDI